MATEDARKLFVAGLPDSITEDALREVFEATGGKVTDVSLPRDRATGRVRGFGFVTFSSPEEAATARDSLDGSLQGGRPISVRPFSSEPPRREGGAAPERGDAPGAPRGPSGGGGGGPGGAGQEDRTLYVGNLPYDVSQQEVSALFTDNALVAPVRIHLPLGPDGRLRGFGFVTCASADAANQSLAVLRNLDVRGRRLMVNIAHPRGERPPGAAPGMSARPPGAGGFGGGGGGFGGGGGGFGGPPRFNADAPPADAGDGTRPPPDARRARNFGPPAPPGGGGGDWADKKKKKGRKTGEPAGAKRERGGGGRSWGKDDDD
ncbi:MAG: RNA-binding protein [Polyangiaceae bacterium]|jgi:RNA recognition motif-containing protein|nr:RNA-binding protein [Polyangiaceae bacterium]